MEKQADKLRRQLRKVESSIKRKREQGDEGDEMRESSAEVSDDDEPEVQSSKAAPAAAAKNTDTRKHCKYYSTGGTCGKKGKCRFVHDPEVREAAMKEREANNGRLTIQQRLMLNDKEQEDLTVLRSIQYLRDRGIMAAATKPEVSKEQPAEKKADEAAPVPKPSTSSLPARPPSLPAVPPKPEANGKPKDAASSSEEKPYDGWLLKPYGNATDDASKK